MPNDITYHKKCTICNDAYTTKSGKSLYCKKFNCKKRGQLNRIKQKQSLTFLYEVQLTLLHRKLDFVLGMLAKHFNFKIPPDMMPKEHKADLEAMGLNLVKIFGKEKAKKEKEVRMINEQIEKLKEFPIEKLPEPKKKTVDLDKYVEPIKKELINIIRRNSGKYPIFPPQADKIIKEIIEKIAGKNKSITPNEIIDTITNKFPDMKTLPYAKDF